MVIFIYFYVLYSIAKKKLLLFGFHFLGDQVFDIIFGNKLKHKSSFEFVVEFS